MLAMQADGAVINTIEGLADEDGNFNALQQAFHENFALQCGYCTPGFLMTLSEYLKDNPNPSKDQIKVALSGNICRCTGYHEIINAAFDAARVMRGI
jgi:carbon-monoxide dehydrogenase small subunit